MDESVPPELVMRSEDGHDLAALVWRFRRPVIAVSTAACGGGLREVSWVVNAQVASGYGRVDLDAHLVEIAAHAGLAGDGVGMFTAVDVRYYHRARAGGASAVATVGVTHPAWAAERAAPALRSAAGTINVVAELPRRVTDGALVNLVATVTEAKCQALADRSVAGTGTPSDAVTVVCRSGGGAEPFGGPRSVWGSRLALATHEAITKALDSGGIR